MTYQPITKNGVAAAEPLDMDAKRQPADLLIEIGCTMDAYPVKLSFSSGIDQLPRIVKRLRELGAEPQGSIVVSQSGSQPEKPRPSTGSGQHKAAQPVAYDDDGTPVCKYHGAMKESAKAPGTYYCPKKLQDGSYCKERA